VPEASKKLAVARQNRQSSGRFPFQDLAEFDAVDESPFPLCVGEGDIEKDQIDLGGFYFLQHFGDISVTVQE
jgi:hypothetical protein